MGTPTTYITLSLRNLGFSTVSNRSMIPRFKIRLTMISQFQTNLLVIPSQCVAIGNLLLLTYMSERVGERLLIAMIQNLW
jgi:hypothetical protein